MRKLVLILVLSLGALTLSLPKNLHNNVPYLEE
jgi:hypothetical protein